MATDTCDSRPTFLVKDEKGGVAMFIEDATRAILYASKWHGKIAGPVTADRARELVEAARRKLYGGKDEER